MNDTRHRGSIDAAFERARQNGRVAFIPYVTAGDPDLETTRAIVASLTSSGADLIELGVPFSDPIADGPVNQRAAERALQQGVTMRSVLALTREISAAGAPPIVLFTYFNPVHRIGLAEFARQAGEAGVSGVLVTDLPVEEGLELRDLLHRSSVELIHLLAPTSSNERVAMIAREARGFLYLISRTGVTGAREDLPPDLEAAVDRVRNARRGIPIAVGFGISRPEQVRAVSRFADGVVVGSALVRIIATHGSAPDLGTRIERFCAGLMAH